MEPREGPQYTSFAADIDHFRLVLQMSDPGDKVPCDRHSGLGLKDDQVTNEKRRGGPSSMLPVATVFAGAIEHWHASFQQNQNKDGDQWST